MISAVVLTHNDNEILSRCLTSLSRCDEVIVIDDESANSTVALAKKQGAKVFVHALHDDFAAQRNFGLSKAKGDWVLFVDSDEVISDALAREIQECIAMPNAKCQMPNGYCLRRKDLFLGKWLEHGETGNVKLLRLGRKDAGKWVQPVHEEWKIQGEIGELTNPLLHYPHPNVAQFLDEINRYSTLYAQHLFHKGIKEPGWYIVGKPAAKFLTNYFWHLGFLDGTAGMILALMMSFHSFLVRGKLWHIHQTSD